MHHHERHPVGDHVVHLPGDTGALLGTGPLGPLLGPVREQRQLPLQGVGPLLEALHQPAPGPYVQAEEHGRHGERDRHEHGEHDDDRGGDAFVAGGAHVGDDEGGRERHRGERRGDAAGHLAGGEGVQPDEAEQEPHRGRRHADADEHHGDGPAAPQDEYGSHGDAEEDARGDRHPALAGEVHPFDRAFEGRQRTESDIKGGGPPPVPPQGPVPTGPALLFPRTGHALSVRRGPSTQARGIPANPG